MSATSKRSGGGSQFGAEVIVVWCVVIAAALGVGTDDRRGAPRRVA